MTELIFTGKLVDDTAQTEQLNELTSFAKMEVYMVLPSTRSDSNMISVPVNDAEVFEIEYDNGIVDFLDRERLDELARDPSWRGLELMSDRATGDQKYYLNDVLFVDSPERGVGNVVPKFIRRFFAKKAVSVSVKMMAQRVDDKNVIEEGLFICSRDSVALVEKINAGKKLEDKPYLLMVHGFASSITSSFGAMSEIGNTGWHDMQKLYEGRILGYNHHSFTKSALQNAFELLEAMPKNLTLDVLSFSRGGLVAEILVKAAETDYDNPEEAKFWEDAFERFEGMPDQDYFKSLPALMRKKNLKVRNFVRSACPAGGTTLASGRLVTYFKVVLNAIGMIPAVKAFPPYLAFKDLILTVIQQKDDPKTLPGVETMTPNSNYVKVLNVLGSQYPITRTPLHVVSGDVKFGKLLHSMKVILSDAFFLGDHDFVVNTISMYQGFRRAFSIDESGVVQPGFHKSFHQSGEVSHFNYLRNPGSREAILSALGQKDVDMHFVWHFYGQKDEVYTLRAHDPKRPTVILLPGIMGSHLKLGKKRIWLNFTELMFGGMGKLTPESTQVAADGAIGLFYNKMVNYLSRSHNVVVHGFDWRSDMMTSADELKKVVEDAMKNTTGPVRIVAHSMGGLLTHALYSKHPDIWDRMRQRPGFRALFMGTPFRGSHAIVNLYLKRHSTFNLLHKIDVLNNSDEMLTIVNRFVGMLQLLPREEKFFEMPFWEQMRIASGKGEEFTIPDEASLKVAKQVLQVFNAKPIEGKELIYLAGLDPGLTPHRVEVNTHLKAIKVFGTVEGDGAVTWASGILPVFEDRVYYSRITHQSLCNKRAIFGAVLDLLEKGETKSNELSKFPVKSRAAQLEYEMPEMAPVSLTVNNAYDLLGLEEDDTDSQLRKPGQPIHVKINHGDLGFASYPVIVGHFEGNDILDAEAAIDRHLNGELSRQLELGAYPGKIGDSLVVLNNKGYFKGAVIAGLGFNDRLTELELEKTLTKALVELALQGDRNTSERSRETRVYGISPLLVGSSYGGLDVTSSLRALLRAIIRTNDMLAESTFKELRLFVVVEIIELYLDKAIDINRALIRMANESEFRDRIVSEKVVVDGTGGHTRLLDSVRASWWHRLQIVEEVKYTRIASDNDENTVKAREQRYMKFVSLSERARAEVESHDLDKALLHVMLAQSVGRTDNDPLLSKALFELLIPYEFKGFVDDMRNITLILDDKTAEYPWEMLSHSLDPNDPPMATRTGLIRQLHDAYYRANVFYAQEQRALVIGDPICSDPFRPLDFAKVEAQEVMKLLANDFGATVEHSINEDAASVLKKLVKDQYKIIHLAGHGAFDPENVTRSGLVLSDNVFLNPTVIGNLSWVPEFVFINCCHLGAVETGGSKQPWNKLAANLGTQYIRIGVKAVIAAGWAVDDRAALDFAKVFYASLFNGDDFGTAVQIARDHCFRNFPHSNTWGAYQCYGNPHYRLKRKDNIARRNENTYVHKAELLTQLRNITAQVDSYSQRDLERLCGLIDGYLEQGSQWNSDCDVVELAAQAYFELRNSEKAMEMYRDVIAKKPHEVSYRSRSNYMKLLINRSVQLVRAGGCDDTEIEGYINEADQQVRLFLKSGGKSEVLTEIGGHFKRLVKLAKTKAKTLEYLLESARYYHEAFELGERQSLYALTNFLQMAALYDMKSGGKTTKKLPYEFTPAIAKKLVAHGQELLTSVKNGVPDFWTTLFEADLLIAEVLAIPTLKIAGIESRIREAVEIIENTWNRSGSWRKLEVIRDHYGFLLRGLDKVSSSGNSRQAAVHKGLQHLCEKIEALQ